MCPFSALQACNLYIVLLGCIYTEDADVFYTNNCYVVYVYQWGIKIIVYVTNILAYHVPTIISVAGISVNYFSLLRIRIRIVYW